MLLAVAGRSSHNSELSRQVRVLRRNVSECSRASKGFKPANPKHTGSCATMDGALNPMIDRKAMMH
eukprot:3419287-Alexandrium_andersonii.AAC.1